MNTNEARVTVLSADVDAREGSFENDKGEQVNYATRKQKAKLDVGGFAYPYDVRLDKDQRPYEPGDYVLDLAAMVQCNKGSISLNKFPVLRAARVAAKA
jgi:hypothetical protein